jgi:hypothetical protein
MTKCLDAAAKSGLCVICQFLCVEEYYALEEFTLFTVDVGFSKEYEFFADELYALTMTTVDFENVFVVVWIYFGEKVSENSLFSRAGWAIE